LSKAVISVFGIADIVNKYKITCINHHNSPSCHSAERGAFKSIGGVALGPRTIQKFARVS